MKVKFTPQDVEIEIAQGQTVMDLAHKNGIPVRSTCNGMPSCAECRVNVTDGDWNINPPSRKELSLIGTGYYIDQRRLACQMLCFGDITVDTTEQIEKCAEGPVTKKFLTKVHKETAAQSHSLGGVMLEENNELLHELQKDVPDAPSALTAASMDESRRKGGGGGRDRGGRGGGGGGRDRGGRGNREARGGSSGNRDSRGSGGGNRDQRGGRDNQRNDNQRNDNRDLGNRHNPADANTPARAPHPTHQPGFATPEMQAGAGLGDRGVEGNEPQARGPRGNGSPREDGSRDGGGRRRRRGGRGRNRGGGGGNRGGSGPSGGGGAPN